MIDRKRESVLIREKVTHFFDIPILLEILVCI